MTKVQCELKEREKDPFLLDDVWKSLGLDRTCGSVYPLFTQHLLSSLGGQGGIATLVASWLERRPDTPGLWVESPVRAHARGD